MSVIQEALRKARKENEGMPVLPILQPKGSNQGAGPGGFAPRRLRGIALGVVLVSAGVGGAVVLHDRFIGAESPMKRPRLVKALPASSGSNPEPEPQKPAGQNAKTTASIPSMERAERLRRAGDLQGAESVLNTLIRSDPERIEAIVALANLYFREMEAPERAYPLYQRVLSLDPNRSAAHVNLGVFFLRKGDLARAREYTKRALELAPDLAEAHYNLACIEALAGNRAAAERALKRATMFNPRSVEWAKDDPDLVLLRRKGASLIPPQ